MGIVRVEHALAVAAARRGDTVLASLDPAGFRPVRAEWREALMGWSAALAPPHMPRRGWRRVVPGRYGIVVGLERVRLTTGRAGVARAADLVQRAVLSVRRHQFPLHDPAGRRVGHVPRERALGPALALGPTDTVLTVGSAWSMREPEGVVALKRGLGFRYVAMCYDLIPATHPWFYAKEEALRFAAYWAGVLPAVDTVIVNAACIADDVRRFCAVRGIVTPGLVTLPLGFDPPGEVAGGALPAGLEAGRFLLFVSTIEPRKGHAVLLRAWRRLLARGVPQGSGFRLVFVGRAGWMVDGVLAELADGAAWGGTVLHLRHVSDAVLAALYEGAAFCLSPSVYEGFGLPIIEAYARGKPVLASSGGAVPETAGGLSPALDPLDDAAWAGAMEDWMLNPASRPSEAAVRTEGRYPTWPEAAEAVLDAAVGGGGGAQGGLVGRGRGSRL